MYTYPSISGNEPITIPAYLAGQSPSGAVQPLSLADIGLPPESVPARVRGGLTGLGAKKRLTADLNLFRASLGDSVRDPGFQISAVKRAAFALIDLSPECLLVNAFDPSKGLQQKYRPFSVDDSVDGWNEIQEFSFRVLVPLTAGGYVDCKLSLKWYMYLAESRLEVERTCHSYLGAGAASEVEDRAEQPLYAFVDSILDRQLADAVEREYRWLVGSSKVPMVAADGAHLAVTVVYSSDIQEIDVKIAVLDFRRKNLDADLRQAIFDSVSESHEAILAVLEDLGVLDEGLLEEAFRERDLPNPTEYYARWKIRIPEVVDLAFDTGDREVDLGAARIVRSILGRAIQAGLFIRLSEYRHACNAVRGKDGRVIEIPGHSLHVLYRMYDAVGSLLYVGITNNFGGRLAAHANTQPWLAHVANVRLEHFSNRDDLEEAERHTIRDERPVHNKVLPAPRTAARPSSRFA